MNLKITYSEHVEEVSAVPAGEHYQLTQHSFFIPLAPGDIVSADDDLNITALIEPRSDVFVVEAFFALGTPPEEVCRLAEEWGRATDVTQSTALTVLVSSTSHQWLTDTVEPHAKFDMQLVRKPGQRLNFQETVKRA